MAGAGGNPNLKRRLSSARSGGERKKNSTRTKRNDAGDILFLMQALSPRKDRCWSLVHACRLLDLDRGERSKIVPAQKTQTEHGK